VIALGGNALLRRGEPPTAVNQRRHVRAAAEALAPLALAHELVISHGNAAPVGLLALQGAAYKSDEAYPLDVLDAETEGMIGYLIEQELANLLPGDRRLATLLTQIEAAVEFVEATGGVAGIGRLEDAAGILSGEAGTFVSADCREVLWWEQRQVVQTRS
jgi:carbamate kinase